MAECLGSGEWGGRGHKQGGDKGTHRLFSNVSFHSESDDEPGSRLHTRESRVNTQENRGSRDLDVLTKWVN